MKNSTYQNWVNEGYEIFAIRGPEGIVIENIAGKLGVSKSTFYYHFGDHAFFLNILLEEHTERAGIMANEAKTLDTFIPGFLNLVVKYKTDVLFNKQLRRHRENKEYQLNFQKASGLVNKEIYGLWADFMGLHNDTATAEKLYNIVEDLFYQRVTGESFTAEWMENLTHELKGIVENLLSPPPGN